MAKQAELTGMEGNRKLQDLHDAAEEYVGIHRARMKPEHFCRFPQRKQPLAD